MNINVGADKSDPGCFAENQTYTDAYDASIENNETPSLCTQKFIVPYKNNIAFVSTVCVCVCVCVRACVRACDRERSSQFKIV